MKITNVYDITMMEKSVLAKLSSEYASMSQEEAQAILDEFNRSFPKLDERLQMSVEGILELEKLS